MLEEILRKIKKNSLIASVVLLRKNHVRKRIFLSDECDFNKAQTRKASKLFKRNINKAVVNFKLSDKKKTHSMRCKISKDYWSYVNSVNSESNSHDFNPDSFFQ